MYTNGSRWSTNTELELRQARESIWYRGVAKLTRTCWQFLFQMFVFAWLQLSSVVTCMRAITARFFVALKIDEIVSMHAWSIYLWRAVVSAGPLGTGTELFTGGSCSMYSESRFAVIHQVRCSAHRCAISIIDCKYCACSDARWSCSMDSESRFEVIHQLRCSAYRCAISIIDCKYYACSDARYSPVACIARVALQSLIINCDAAHTDAL